MKKNQSNSLVYVIFGPTGIGKTDLLKNNFQGNYEVINCDSRQVYKYLDIGTAKPTNDVLEAVPHHLIDIILPSQQFSVSDFLYETNKKLTEIISREKTPVLCGGTAFYIKNFLFGLPSAPATEKSSVEKIEKEILNGKREEYYSYLKKVDNLYAQKISPNDTYRLSRAVSIYQTTGNPLSSYAIPTKIREDYDFKIIELFREKEELNSRIEQRVQQMFDLGLKREVENVLNLGFSKDSPGLKSIGYSEWFLGLSDKEVFSLIVKNSRQYAKRQRTFFKLIPNTLKLRPEEFSLNIDNNQFLE